MITNSTSNLTRALITYTYLLVPTYVKPNRWFIYAQKIQLIDWDFFCSTLWMYRDVYFLGENTLLVPTFWVNSHFGSKIDFVTNVVPNKRKSFLKWSLPSTH